MGFKEIINKRGQALQILSIFIILSIAIYGTADLFWQKSNFYVGVKSSNSLYKYDECKEEINSLDENDLILFTSKEDGEKHKFVLKSCDELREIKK